MKLVQCQPPIFLVFEWGYEEYVSYRVDMVQFICL